MIPINYVKVPLNDVVMEIVEGIWRLKDATFSQDDEVYSSFTRNESVIRCSRENARATYPKSSVRGSVIQTLIYLLSLYKLATNEKIVFKASEVTRLRGVAARSENRKTLLEDLQFLSEINMEINHTVKSIQQETCSRILRFRVINHSVQVVFGSWIKAVSPNKYVELPVEFFQYKGQRHSHSMLAMLKVTQLMHMSKNKLRISSLLGFLGYDQLSLYRKRLSAVVVIVSTVVRDNNKADSICLSLAQSEFTTLLELQNTIIHIRPKKKIDNG